MKILRNLIIVVIAFCVLSVEGITSNNSWIIPTSDDFSSWGVQGIWKLYDSVNVAVTNILGSTNSGDKVIIPDTIRGNVFIDSIAGTENITSGTGGVDLDTLKNVDKITSLGVVTGVAGSAGVQVDTLDADVLLIGSGNEIDSLAIIDDTGDTLIIKSGSDIYEIVIDSKQ